MLDRLQTLTGQEGCSYHDLDIIIAFYKKIEFSILKYGTKGVPLYDKQKQQYQFLKLKDTKGCELFDKLDKSQILKIQAESQENSSDKV